MDGRLDGFRDKIKVAISAGMTMGLLRGRIAQGARVAPALMQRAEQAVVSGAKTTTPALRHMALGAGESARAAGKATALAPVKAPLQARMAAGEALGAKAFDQSRTLKIHDALGNTHGYSPEYMKTITGGATVHEHVPGILASRPAPAVGATMRAPDATQVGQVGGRSLVPGGGVRNGTQDAVGTAVKVRRPAAAAGLAANRAALGTAPTQIAFRPGMA